MILIDVSGANAIVRKQDTLTSGMVGATVVFRFDKDWDSLAKTAVFRAGKVTKDAIVVDSMSEIPHEVLATHGYALEIGVYGTADDGAVVIPTIWAKTNHIKLGADPSGDESVDPSLPVWAQMQEQLDAMYRSSGEIKEAKEELMQAIAAAKEDLDDIVAAGGYYSKTESGSRFASAIKGNLSGPIVAADDVSPVEHFLSVKTYGKNLIDNIDDFVKESATVYTYEDGVLTITGGYAIKWVKIEAGKTYTFSCNSVRYGATGGGYYLRAYTEDKNSYRVVAYDTVTLSPRCTFTAEQGDCYLRIAFYGSTKSNPEDTSVYSNIQLEEGTEATEYVPYISPAEATVVRCSKNLIQYPFAFATRTINGVTFTPHSDGTVFVRGTATANTYFALNGGFNSDAVQIPCTLKPGEEYTITDAMVFLYKDGATKAFNEGSFVMVEGYDYYGIFVYVPSGATVETVLMPQLELGGSSTEFMPYFSESYIAEADGTVEDVVSLAPGMALYAESEGLYLDVEYNRDTVKVVEEILNQVTPAARIASVKLLASKWTGSGNLYSQVVSIAGITENSQVNLAPSVEQLAVFYEKDLTFVTENDGGVVTVYVIGQKPQNDYTIQADIVEVIA